MPKIPILETQDPTHIVEAPRADVNAFMAPGEALARSGAAIEQLGQETADKAIEQRRMMTISNTAAQYSPKLADLEHKWSLVPDREQAIAGFNQDAVALHKQYIDAIADPEVKAILTDRFNQEAITYQHSAGEEAFKRESSKHLGDTEQSLLALSTQAARAPNDHARAIIADNGKAVIAAAVAGGWMAPADGAVRQIKFNSDVLAVKARDDLNNAIDTQDPDKMYALAQKLGDPANYPGMLQDEREALRGHAETMAYRLQMRAASREAHADAIADRNFHMAQAHNEAVTLAAVNSGAALTDAQIQQMADRGQISAGGVEALHTARVREEDGHDDPLTAAHLWDAIGNNVASTGNVYDLYKQGRISKPTMVDAVKAIDAKNTKGDSQQDKGNYNVLRTALSGGAIESGNLFGDKSGAAANWAQAQGEWNRRVVVGGEDSATVLSDMIPRYSTTISKPTWLAPTRFGTPASTKDVMAAAAKLGAAYKSKQISQSDFQAQAELLTDYRRFYALEDQRAHARGLATGRARPAGGGAQLVGMTPGSGE